MGWLTRTLMFGILAAGLATNLPAQRGEAARGALSPSSTALGAGAFSGHPSSTARSSMAARSSGYRYGGYSSSYARSRGAYNRNLQRLPFAYWVAPYYYYAPLDYGDSYGQPDSGYDSPDPNAQAILMAQDALADQVQRLSAQVAQLQYGQQVQAQPNAQEQLPPEAPVTLVLRNGQQLQVQNYAVMNETFWDLSRQPVRKIPISSIDVAASEKATTANGGEFPQLAGTQ